MYEACTKHAQELEGVFHQPKTALGPVHTIRDAQVLNDNSQDKARGGRILVGIQPTSNDGLRKMHQKMGMPGSVNRP